VIQGSFGLVGNVKAKHGVLDDDTHNFDETGFMMGLITQEAIVAASGMRRRSEQI
jgi:hypothetical protein